MLAYHGKESIKNKYLARVSAHEKADEIIRGLYWQRGKGCAVGCTIHGNNHAAYEKELGIPRIIARLEDGIFEGLPNKEAKSFPRKFLAAIKPGADLSQVADKFLHWLLVDKKDGVIKYAKTDAQRKAIQDVGDLYARKIKGEKITHDTWVKSSNAAYAAAYAVCAAAYAAAEEPVYAAAYAVCAAAYAARQKSRSKQAKKLLALLKAAK